MKLRTAHTLNLLEKIQRENLPFVVIGGVERLKVLYPKFAHLFAGYDNANITPALMPPNTIVLITTRHYKQAFESLKHFNNNCYILYYTERCAYIKDYKMPCVSGRSQIIPKKIHYFWFGPLDIPPHYQAYINGWKEKHPNWEIIKWNESNYDINKHPFLKAAYENKQWAFVSDYARFDTIYKHGGIYLDCDMEIIKPLDKFLYDDMFFGVVEFATHMQYQFQIMGAKKGCSLARDCRDLYGSFAKRAKKENFFLEMETKHIPALLASKGFKAKNEMQLVNGIRVYPQDVLTPSDWFGNFHTYSTNTHAIHHYGGSWFDEKGHKLHSKIRENAGYDFFMKNICVEHKTVIDVV